MSIEDVSSRRLEDLISLRDRVAVVTGAAWGLGRATARRLAEAGAAVLIADLDEEKAAATASELAQEFGGKVLSVKMDASDPGAIIAAADMAVRELGSLDIWVNNAGVPSHVPLFDLSVDEFDKVQAINLRGTFVGAREAASRMVAAGKGGVIVNVASLAGVNGIAAGQAAYVASKHGVVGLTRQMAIELAPSDIRVLGVAPGVMLTEKTMFLADAGKDMVAATGIPGIGGGRLGRHGSADDIARTILFCASDMAMFMTGSTLIVDGGVLA